MLPEDCVKFACRFSSTSMNCVEFFFLFFCKVRLSMSVAIPDSTPRFLLSHLLALLTAAEQDVPQVHQVGQQGVALLTLTDQIAAARVPGRRPAGHHFVPAGRAATHRRRRNHAVEHSRCCHGVYDVRGGRSAWPFRDVVF